MPRPLVLGELSQEARIKLWDRLVFSAWTRSRGSWWNWKPPIRWIDIFRKLHSEFFVRPLDEFISDSNHLVPLYRELILSDLVFHEVFDLLQFIMRHPYCPDAFISEVAAIFKECRLAYAVDPEQPATIFPAATEQEGETIIGAINELRQAGLSGAAAHLKEAGKQINAGTWAGAVRESINAVESVARQLDPDSSKELEPALASLERKGRLHPAMKQAFSRLYGYTSDEEGIRHALLTNAASPAGRDEAVFMLGACASFASYLWRRHRSGS